MKKRISKILTALLCLTISCSSLAVLGCGGYQSDLTLKTPGAVVNGSNGGFTVETQNYVYFINGVGEKTMPNNYGDAVKGALMVADKTNYAVSQTLVPKLIVSEDLKAGIYLFGEYVYYATPSTKIDTSGAQASSYVDFCRSKVDGSETNTFLSVNGTNLQFRFAEKDGVVYIVYYNNDDATLYSYNTTTKSKSVIVEEPALYTFNTNEGLNDIVVTYTLNSEKDYSTETYAYNKLYAYKVGEQAGKLVLDGTANSMSNVSLDELTYQIVLFSGEYTYYSATNTQISDTAMQTKYYAIKTADLYNAQNVTAVSTVLDTSLASANLNEDVIVEAPQTAYALETETAEGEEQATATGYIIKYDLTKSLSSGLAKSVVAKGSSGISKLVSVNYKAGTNDISEIYYLSAEGCVARYNAEKDREEIVTEDTVNADWYALEFVGNVLMYVNGSAEGCNYVNAISLNSPVTEEDEDDDGINDYFYIDKGQYQLAMGKMSALDGANVVVSLLDSQDVSKKIVFDTDADGKVVVNTAGEPVNADIDKIIAKYNALTDDQKSKLTDENKTKYQNVEKAYDVSRKLYKLFGFDDVTKNKDDFKGAYETAKADVDYLLQQKANGDENATEILQMIVENGRWYLQKCEAYFA